jgi:hypothetical protein
VGHVNVTAFISETTPRYFHPVIIVDEYADAQDVGFLGLVSA